MANILLAEKILKACADQGVAEYCLCAGARNSPLVMLLAKAQGIQVYSFFEERSAAFFALGLVKRSGRPVAVVTTSGTAVAELLPAAVEANYAGLPLLLITADRPRSYRGTGAPQAIDQVGIFSNYIETCWDIESSEDDLRLQDWSRTQALQINICFSEPLIDSDIKTLSLAPSQERPAHKSIALGSSQIRKMTQPLIVIGALKSHEVKGVHDYLARQQQAIVYCECISQLRGFEDLQKYFFKGTERDLQKLFDNGTCQSLLRIGGVPTLRLWRDLEDRYKHVPVYSISNEEWVGLSRPVRHTVGLSFLNLFELQYSNELPTNLWIGSQPAFTGLIKKWSRSETALLFDLAHRLSAHPVYLGNSLPIRQWDMVAPYGSSHGYGSGSSEVEANRGANGIDGQISTYLGWSQGVSESWACVGDLTALYDPTSLWITPHLKNGRRRIVIVNNQGGQIFKNIFNDSSFINHHQIGFRHWALQWGWDYQEWTAIPTDLEMASNNVIIELKPDAESSDQFWQEYRHL